MTSIAYHVEDAPTILTQFKATGEENLMGKEGGLGRHFTIYEANINLQNQIFPY